MNSARCRGLALSIVLAMAAPAAAQSPDEAPAAEEGDSAADPSGSAELPPGHPPPRGATAAPPSGEGRPAGALPPGHPPPPSATAPPSGDEGHAGAPAASGNDALPPGHPRPQGGTAVGADPSGHVNRILSPPNPATATASDEVPEGTIRVLVVDPAGRPVPEQAVDVGGLNQGERTRFNGRTDANGVAVFEDLATGSGQAYRVNVPHDGATYSTMPFQLESGRGFQVRVTRYPATTDSGFVFFHIFRIIIEQRGERMHIITQAELTNAGEAAYVFPEDGLRGALPEDATTFQFQRVVTDQRVEELQDSHEYVMRGSLPPGTVRLAWAYDLPIEGGDMAIPFEVPVRAMNLQVLTEAVPELDVSVSGMPRPRKLGTDGQSCESSAVSEGCAWVTQVGRAPDQPQIRRLTVHLSGIPGPSPVRFFAVAIAVLFGVFGVLALITAGAATSGAEARAVRRRALREEAELLAEELEEGEIGPEYAARRRAEIVRELAGLYFADEVEIEHSEDEAARRHGPHAPGIEGFLKPAPDSSDAGRAVEIALGVLSLPLLIVPTLFVLVRPRAMMSMKGQGEVAVTFVLGLASMALLYVLFDSTFEWDPVLTWCVLGGLGASLALRTAVRRVSPPVKSPAQKTA